MYKTKITGNDKRTGNITTPFVVFVYQYIIIPISARPLSDGWHTKNIYLAMDLKNVKSKLDTVNRFYDYLSTNEDQISKLDKDAFLDKIRALYDTCFEEKPAQPEPIPTPQPEPKPEPKIEEPISKNRKTKVVFTHTDEPTPKVETPKPEPKVEQPKPEPKPEPKIEEPKPEPKPEPKVEEPKPEPKIEQPKPQPKKEEPRPQPKPTPKVEEVYQVNEEYDSLFTLKIATDLSQKLSAAPIADLTKALGLNEKFLYINELFGGDVNVFQETIQQLNNFKDLGEARVYLEQHLIEQQGWLSKKERTPTAKNFIKLISRRYFD